jgi:hypothetical protein
MFFFILFLLFSAFWWYFRIARIPEKFPQGPYGVPFLGYLPVVFAENMATSLESVHKKYGPVVSVNIGNSKRTVVIGDYNILKVS